MNSKRYPEVWSWAHEQHPKRLCEWGKAPEANGFYEIGYVVKGVFQPKYCGRAARVSLRTRLHQHFHHSHSEHVQKRRDKLWYRCKIFPTSELASYVEAVHISALEYAWNNRNEWERHWILET